MEEKEYSIALRNVLDENSTIVLKKLNTVLKSIPEKTKSIEIVVFPDQDGEGTFDIRLTLTGPDLYVLNKAIQDSADLFDVIHTSEGLKPSVPLMDPFDSSFEVNNVLADVVAEWIQSIWNQSDKDHIEIPVYIVAEDDYGMNLPFKLN